MNMDLSREALGMRCPGKAYVASPRERAGPEEMLDGTSRLSYRRNVVCCFHLRSGAPRVMAGPEGEE
jgi:hypothetical protein